MEITLLLAILLFAFLIFKKQKKLSAENQDQFKNLESKIDDLKKQLASKPITIEKNQPSELSQEAPIEKPVTAEVPIVEKEEIPIEKEVIVPTETHIEEIKKVETVEVEKPVTTAAFSSNYSPIKAKKEIVFETTKPYEPLIPKIPKKSWMENFREKNPDIEKFIGENLINKIGILILVLGISFFVKYAIDKDWINEPARVGIGILAGSIVMGIAHRLRKNYAAFSSVFVAGAISIFYLTIGIAYHDYKLFNQTVAFIIMVVITIFGAFVSISYNRKELAILSLIGGFAVPFMVSSGEGNYKVLMTYIAILNIGMLIIAYFKKWSIVTLLAFIFTCILYSSWFGYEFSSDRLPYKGAFFFATLFYLIFSIATVINNIRNKGSFTKLEYFIMLTNTFFYFGMGATIIENWKPELKGVFTIALALYNLVFAIVLYRKFGINKNAIYFLLGLALTFITLTIPFQFNGNYITLFWATEAVLLLWLSQKSKIPTFKVGGIIVQILMISSLLIDWGQAYSLYEVKDLKPLLNKIFITGLVAVASLVATYYLLKKEKTSTKFYFLTIDPKIYGNIALVASVIVAYFVGIFEVSYQSMEYIPNYYSALAYPILYHSVFSAILIFFLLKNKKAAGVVIAIALATINIALYIVFVYQLPYNEILENQNLNFSGKSAYYIHYLLLLCVGYFLYVLVKNRTNEHLFFVLENKITPWIFAFCVVYILSNEVMIHGLLLNNDIINKAELAKRFPILKGNEHRFDYDKDLYLRDHYNVAKEQIIKIGYPILWGLLSFVFLILGIKKQNKTLRIIALSLLGLTIVKLFVYDIKNVSETGKIIAFILLGVLILIISFVYQKIKKLVVDEPKNNTDEEIS